MNETLNLAGNVHFDVPDASTTRDGQVEMKFAVAVAAMLALVIFAIDLAIPLGVAAGVPYIAVILAAWWMPGRRGAFAFASASTALIVIGYLYSQEAGIPWMAVANRALAVFAIWTTAVLLLLAKRSARSLEGLVRERTRALRESEARFQEIAASTSDTMWEMDENLRFTLLAGDIGFPDTDRLLGLTRWQAVGVDPDTDEFWRRHRETLLAREAFRDFHYNYVDPAGKRHDILISGTPFSDETGVFKGYRGVGRNITDLKRLEKAAATADRQIRVLTDALPVLIGYVDKNQCYRLNNKEYENWTGRNRDDLQGMHIRDALGEEAYNAIRPHVEKALAGETVNYTDTVTYDHGGARHIKATYVPDLNEYGEVDGFFAMVMDITDLKNAEAEARETHEIFKTVTDNYPISVWRRIKRGDGMVVTALSANCLRDMNELGESDPDNPVGLVDYMLPEYRQAFDSLLEESANDLLENPTKKFPPREIEFAIRTPSGQLRWIQNIILAHLNGDGEVVLDSLAFDITARREAEEALRESETRMRSITDNLPLAVFRREMNEDGFKFVPFAADYMRALCELGPYDPDKSEQMADYMLPEFRPKIAAIFEESAKSLTRADYEYALRTKSGKLRWMQCFAQPFRDEHGAVYWDGVAFDITERREAETDAREAQRRLATITDNIPISVYRRTFHDGAVETAPYNAGRIRELAGLGAFDPENPRTLPDLASPEDREKMDRVLREAADSYSPLELDFSITTSSGETRWISNFAYPQRDRNGEVYFDGVAMDITERKLAEEEVKRARDDLQTQVDARTRELRTANETLSESEEQLRLITDNIPVLISYIDANGRYKFVNKTGAEWHGRPAADIVGRLVGEVHDNATCAKLKSKFKFTNPDVVASFEETVPYGDGVDRVVQATTIPHIDAAGKILGFFGVAVDLTERKAIEDQLRQAQKMEVMGKLTGGVAHDFNNLLGVIVGNLEFLEEEFGEDDPRHDYLQAALRATSRGAELTYRLLSFARKQALQPVATDIGALVSEIVDAHRRTLGERITVNLNLSEGLNHANIDGNQLETALLNLFLNAQHAMGGDGTLTLGASNITLNGDEFEDVAPGRFVKLAVSDTGVGMSAEVLAQASDPFFTTKDVGEGSGLGLSMVEGFAKQSGGHIVIESELGRGATVTLYLPASDAVSKVEGQIAAGAVLVNTAKQEKTILVVEDDPDLKDLATSLIASLQYRVLSAKDGPAALEVLRETPEIDLLFSDVVLPNGMNGAELAAQALALAPSLKVLFTSGYNKDLLLRDGVLEKGVELVAKPYRKAELSLHLRRALAG